MSFDVQVLQTEVTVSKEQVVVLEVAQVQQGPPGPPGANGLGFISADPGNSITTGTDGGLYCPAVTTATTDW